MSVEKNMEELGRKWTSQFFGQPRLARPDISLLIREAFSEDLGEVMNRSVSFWNFDKYKLPPGNLQRFDHCHWSIGDCWIWRRREPRWRRRLKVWRWWWSDRPWRFWRTDTLLWWQRRPGQLKGKPHNEGEA